MTATTATTAMKDKTEMVSNTPLKDNKYSAELPARDPLPCYEHRPRAHHSTDLERNARSGTQRNLGGCSVAET